MRIRLVFCLCTAILPLLLMPDAHATLAPAKASETLTLLGSTGSPACTPGFSGSQIDTRQNGDGSTSPFIQPPKSAYVVTSFDFIFQSGRLRRTSSSGSSWKTRR